VQSSYDIRQSFASKIKTVPEIAGFGITVDMMLMWEFLSHSNEVIAPSGKSHSFKETILAVDCSNGEVGRGIGFN
jgi:hypothetical protein